MKVRHALLTLALACAIWLAFYADKSPADGLSEPSKPGTALRTEQAHSINASGSAQIEVVARTKAVKTPDLLRIQLRPELVGNGNTVDKKIDLFPVANWPPALPVQTLPSPPPAPPVAPSLPFKFIGKKLEASNWEVYLARDQRTLVATKGAVLEGSYRVDAIEPPTMRLTYLPLDQVQQLNIGPTE